MKNIYKIILATVLLFPFISFATTTIPWQTKDNTSIFPTKINGTIPHVRVGNIDTNAGLDIFYDAGANENDIDADNGNTTPLRLNNSDNNVIIGSNADNGYRFQVAGSQYITGDYVSPNGSIDARYIQAHLNGITSQVDNLGVSNPFFAMDLSENELFVVTPSGSLRSDSTIATSTFAWAVQSPCFTNNGTTCLTTGGSGSISSGLAGQLTWYASNGTTVSGTSTGQITIGNLLATSTTATSTIMRSLGIGTTTPWATLAVNPIAGNAANQFVVGSSTATNFIITNAGKVGIGSTTPFSPLTVVGTTTVGSNYSNYLSFAGSNGVPSIASIGSSADVDLGFNPQGNGQTIYGGGGWAYTDAGSGKASILFNNGNEDTPNLKFQYANNSNYGIDVEGTLLRFIHNADESGGAVVAGLGTSGTFFTNGYLETTGGITASIGANDHDIRASLDLGTAGKGVYLQYSDQTQWRDALSIKNTSSGFGNLVLMQPGGNVGVGTSSPYASLSVQSNSGTGDAFVIATSTGATVAGEDNDGHRFTSGPAPIISSCGTGSGSVVGDDQNGTITTATAAVACTATFSKAYRNTPTCRVTDDSLVGFADVSSISTSAVTFGISSALTGGHLYYECSYHK